jgi:hypothetical protein
LINPAIAGFFIYTNDKNIFAKNQKMKKLLLVLTLLFCSFFSKADEGMWFPQLLQQLNIADMQMRGLKISAEDIYSVNKSSLKDAIVLFGGGCTGEIISKQFQ